MAGGSDPGGPLGPWSSVSQAAQDRVHGRLGPGSINMLDL